MDRRVGSGDIQTKDWREFARVKDTRRYSRYYPRSCIKLLLERFITIPKCGRNRNRVSTIRQMVIGTCFTKPVITFNGKLGNHTCG